MGSRQVSKLALGELMEVDAKEVNKKVTVWCSVIPGVIQCFKQ